MSSTEQVTPRGSIKAVTEKKKKSLQWDLQQLHVNADSGQGIYKMGQEPRPNSVLDHPQS